MEMDTAHQARITQTIFPESAQSVTWNKKLGGVRTTPIRARKEATREILNIVQAVKFKERKPRDQISKAVAAILDTDNHPMGVQMSCPDDEIARSWTAICGESFSQSAALYFMGRAQQAGDDAVYDIAEATMRPAYAQRAYEHFIHVGIREACHLQGIGLSSEGWEKAMGESYDATAAKASLATIARRRAKGEKMRPVDFINARVHATAAGVTGPENMAALLGISGNDWQKMTGVAFSPVEGAFRDRGGALQPDGSVVRLRSYYLNRPVQYQKGCHRG